MGCNIPRPSKRPPTPPISDQPYGSKTNEAVEALTRFSRAEIEAFKQFGQVAHDLTYYDTDLDKPRKEHVTNCPNCCATITGPGVTTVLDTGIKKKENIEFAVRGFVDNEAVYLGCFHGYNGETIAIMYAEVFSEGEQNDIRTKVESAADNQKEV